MTTCNDAILKITDGETSFDLLRGPIRLKEWRMATAGFKSGGVFQDNPMADGRILSFARFDNLNEVMSIVATGVDPDAAAFHVENLMALLKKASAYGQTEWQNSPVWIEARARNESNTRYCLIVNGSIPELDNPYRQPFRQHDGSVVMDQLSMGIEHGLWQNVPPGQTECTEIYVRPDLDRIEYSDKVLATDPLALWPLVETAGTKATNIARSGAGMNGTHSGVSLDNLKFPNGEPTPFYGVSAAYTDIYSTPLSTQYSRRTGSIMAWIRTDSGIIWTSGNVHWIVRLYSDVDNGIGIYKSADDNTLVGHWTVGSSNVIASFTIGSAIPDTGWLPVILTWESFDDVDVFLRLYVYGELRAVKYGIFGSLAGSGLLDPIGTVIGAPNTLAVAEGFSADISYVGIWDRVLSHEEAIELSEYPAAISAETSCENIVFAANKHYPAQLTHIYVFDTSVSNWTANLIESDPPYNLLPTASGVGDLVYFGIGTSTSVLYTGYFNNLIFDFSPEDGADVAGVWEYYNSSAAAWQGIALTSPNFMMDHTSGMMEDNVTSIHWQDLTNWGTRNLLTNHGGSAPNITAYWIRFRVTSVGAAYDPPRQQNRHPYTAGWGYIEIPEASSQSSLQPLIKMIVQNQKQSPVSDYDNVSRLFVGGRSLSRGYRFQAYLNFCQKSRQVDGVTATAGTDSAIVSTIVESPTTQAILYSGGAGSSYATIATISLDGSIAPEFYGRYRAFVRYQAATMIAAGTLLRLGVAASGVYYTEPAYPTEGGAYKLLDFGSINIGPAGALHSTEYFRSVDLFIQAKETGGSAHSIHLYDLVLIPIDEWAGEFLASDRENSPIAYDIDEVDAERSRLVIDSASLPKTQIRAYSQLEQTLGITSGWRCINKRPAFVNTGAQRLWLLGIASPAGVYAKPSLVYRIQLEMVKRYQALRGNR